MGVPPLNTQKWCIYYWYKILYNKINKQFSCYLGQHCLHLQGFTLQVPGAPLSALLL